MWKGVEGGPYRTPTELIYIEKSCWCGGTQLPPILTLADLEIRVELRERLVFVVGCQNLPNRKVPNAGAGARAAGSGEMAGFEFVEIWVEWR